MDGVRKRKGSGSEPDGQAGGRRPASEQNSGTAHDEFAVAEGEKVDARTAHVWMRPDGILQLRVKRGIEIDLDDARELMQAVRALAGGKHPVLLDHRWSHSLTHEAQIRFFEPKDITALAIVAWTRIARIASEFLLGAVKAPYPARVFTSEEEAVLWLSQYL
jgi:hypothetical protein